MPSYKSEFTFKLSKPIKYQAKLPNGFEFKETSDLILRAPSLRSHFRHANVLEALFIPALLEAQSTMSKIAESTKKSPNKEQEDEEDKEKKSEEEEEMEANKILAHFSLMTLGEKINTFYDAFESFLLSDNICFLSDNTKLSDIELNEISYEDFKKLTREYLAVFFIASWLTSLGGN